MVMYLMEAGHRNRICKMFKSYAMRALSKEPGKCSPCYTDLTDFIDLKVAFHTFHRFYSFTDVNV